MAQFPSLPLFTDAYLADTTHLSVINHGRYLLLLIHMWRSPGCRMPNDDNWLSRKFQVTPQDIAADWRPLIAEFMQTDGNWIFQKRLQKEWVWCQSKKYQSSVAAKSRWRQDNPFSERISDGNAMAMPPTLQESKKDLTTLASSGTNSEWPTASPQLAEIVSKQMGRSAARATAPRDGALARPPSTNAVPVNELTAAEIIEARRKKAAANGSKFYAPHDSAQLLAWEQFTGSVSRDTDGGCWFPTEWPPTIRSALAAN